MYYYRKFIIRSIFLNILIYISILNLVYPVYSIVRAKYPDNILIAYRGDVIDRSFETRNTLTLTIFNELKKSSTHEIIFGHGSESSRRLVEKIFNEDIMVHNDFIRFFYDFGFVGSILLLILLSELLGRNFMTFVFGTLYLISFYHNMIYSKFLLGILIIIYYNTAYNSKFRK
jgi:hypothetical protein